MPLNIAIVCHAQVVFSFLFARGLQIRDLGGYENKKHHREQVSPFAAVIPGSSSLSTSAPTQTEALAEAWKVGAQTRKLEQVRPRLSDKGRFGLL